MATTTTKKETTEEVVKETKPVETKSTKSDNVDEKLEKLTDLMAQFMQAMVTSQGNHGAKSVSENAEPDTVRIVHLVERAPGLTTYMKLSSTEVIFRKFGEERTLSFQAFQELVGKYRKWFDMGIISIAAGYEDLAERYGLNTAKNYPMDSEFVKKLGDVSMYELENIFPKLPEAGKDFILSYWNRKVIEGDPNFKDARKIETLNRLSGECMTPTLRALSLEKGRKN